MALAMLGKGGPPTPSTTALARLTESVNVPVSQLRLIDDCLARCIASSKQGKQLCLNLQTAFTQEEQLAEDCRGVVRTLCRESGIQLY